jgi:serine/threonine-protein kinase
MKTALLPVIALFAIGGLAAVSRASDSTIEIDSRSYAAIAYSPATGKYGYSYDHRSRSNAEKAALEKCGAEDAQIACWIKRGFCALALGDDKTCWGVGWRYGGGSSNTDAKDTAMKECGNRTTGAHIVLCLSSDGQYVWDVIDHTTIIDSHGNVYRGGQLVTPTPSVAASASASVSPSPQLNKTDH